MITTRHCLLVLAAAISAPCFGADTARIVLGNDHLRLEFQRPHMGLAAMVDLAAGIDHISASPATRALWSLTLKAGPGAEDTVTLASTDAPCTSARAKGRTTAIFRWSGLRIEDDTGAIDVRVRVDLPPDSGIAQWRIWVDNASATYGLWEVTFPELSGYLQPGQYDIAAPTVNWGILSKRVTGEVAILYPHGYSGTMPFMCATRGDHSVYMAAHDPGASRKEVRLTPGGRFHVKALAENMGVPGSDHYAPYPTALGVYEGDWLAGCKIYRKHALGTHWMKGRRAAREEASLRDVALWMRVGDETPDVSREWLLKAQEYFDVPLGVHWYFWHSNPMDDVLPDYLPPKPGYAAAWRDLVDRGFVVMPYINGRQLSETAAEFDRYEPYLCRNADGEVYDEKYADDVDHPVCPYTDAWQDRIAEICIGIAKAGANAIYLDQVSGEPPTPCFDASHGHPLGGGRWWVDGYAEMLHKCRRAGKGVALTGEFPAECYGFEGFLVWTTRVASSIPMLAAVYSGTNRVYFGTNTFLSYTDRAWIMREGRDFLWGTACGWFNPRVLLQPEHATKAQFLRKIGKMRVAGREYISYGELVGLIDHPSQTVTEEWPSHGAGKVTLPSVQGSIWKARDGSLGIFLVNYLERESAIDIEVDTSRYNLDLGVFNQEVILGPWEIRLIEVAK